MSTLSGAKLITSLKAGIMNSPRQNPHKTERDQSAQAFLPFAATSVVEEFKRLAGLDLASYSSEELYKRLNFDQQKEVFRTLTALLVAQLSPDQEVATPEINRLAGLTSMATAYAAMDSNRRRWRVPGTTGVLPSEELLEAGAELMKHLLLRFTVDEKTIGAWRGNTEPKALIPAALEVARKAHERKTSV